jgi:16S rRNA (cytosine967-C5)-methyltransferase
MITLDKYILQANDILELYQYPQPFHLFIKNYFKQYKKFGSRDRKTLKNLLYSNFRLPFDEMDWESKFNLATQAQQQMYTVANSKIHYHQTVADQLKTKLKNLPLRFDKLSFSAPLEEGDFLIKTLVPPFTFIRSHIKKLSLLQQLADQGIDAINLEANAISITTPNVDLEATSIPFRQYAVQDYASQMVCDLFEPKNEESWWDCCAASGGKSIALLQKNEHIQLTITDIRSTILHNLKKRLATYQLKVKDINVHDATKPLPDKNKFDSIICDVPCSGSGTWARTPEQLYYHNSQNIIDLQVIQKEIVQNAVNHLHRYGTLFYITCSVFKAENEDIVDHILANNNKLELQSQQLIDGRKYNSDFLFVAVIKKID